MNININVAPQLKKPKQNDSINVIISSEISQNILMKQMQIPLTRDASIEGSNCNVLKILQKILDNEANLVWPKSN